MIIPMDTATPPTTPLGPMTRARVKAIEDEVNSLLSELPLSMHETWLLPKSELLCMIRYQEDPSKDAHEDGQDPKSMEEENQWKKARTASRHRTSGQDPGHPAPGTSPTAAAQPPSTISDRTSGASPGHPAPRQSPDIQPFPRKSGIDNRRHPKFGHFSPDIRPPARTSGACLRAESGQRPMYPFHTYPFVA